MVGKLLHERQVQNALFVSAVGDNVLELRELLKVAQQLRIQLVFVTIRIVHKHVNVLGAIDQISNFLHNLELLLHADVELRERNLVVAFVILEYLQILTHRRCITLASNLGFHLQLVQYQIDCLHEFQKVRPFERAVKDFARVQFVLDRLRVHVIAENRQVQQRRH